MLQDSVVLVAPQPNNPALAESFDFRTDMDLSGGGLQWYAIPQLFFRCTMPHWLPSSSQAEQGSPGVLQPELHKPWWLSALLNPLTPNADTQSNAVPMFYNTASSSKLPSLCICLARNVLGRVPLTPCFVRGNRTPTLPHSLGNRQGAVAYSRNGAGRQQVSCAQPGVTAGLSHAGLLAL